MNITGHTRLIAHLGYPTHSFKAPMIYNPWFEETGVDVVVTPMGVRAEDLAVFLPPLFRLSNVCGALITMPHKVAVVKLLDVVSTAVKVAGACNAVRLREDGKLIGDMFDGEGFVRGLRNKGQALEGRRVLCVGCGGVGSAIAASLAGAGVAELHLFDAHAPSAEGLAGRLRTHYPKLKVVTGSNDPAGFDIVLNATPMGMDKGDPMPMDVARIPPSAFVGEVVMKRDMTRFLTAARDRGCRVQVGVDMLFEQIPAYLEFFGLPVTTPAHLREIARIAY